ncbi:hypothetical protein M885DRAFT_568970 [Pelagophyceae sp. CCMP2097]|nr:hypothetical protein M885DRAFT_568970 [Pelagophyceae sp. CCMP2097]
MDERSNCDRLTGAAADTRVDAGNQRHKPAWSFDYGGQLLDGGAPLVISNVLVIPTINVDLLSVRQLFEQSGTRLVQPDGALKLVEWNGLYALPTTTSGGGVLAALTLSAQTDAFAVLPDKDAILDLDGDLAVSAAKLLDPYQPDAYGVGRAACSAFQVIQAHLDARSGAATAAGLHVLDANSRGHLDEQGALELADLAAAAAA